jgi:hypothetical protein
MDVGRSPLLHFYCCFDHGEFLAAAERDGGNSASKSTKGFRLGASQCHSGGIVSLRVFISSIVLITLKVKNIEGVVSYSLPRVYQISHGQYVGSIRVQAMPNFPEYILRQKVVNHFHGIGVTDMTVQVEQDQSQTI